LNKNINDHKTDGINDLYATAINENYIYTLCPPKRSPFYFWNNSVKNKPISIIFSTRTSAETWH